MFTLSAASVTNLILDPIFIFGWFGLPRMETSGAAIATVIGQIAGMMAGIFINRRWNKEIPFGFTLRPDMQSVKVILKVGIPSMLVQVLTSFVGILMNSILLMFSTTAVAVYDVCTRIFSISTVGVHGINNGLIPVIAYNYGASNRKRISDAVKWAMGYAVLPLVFAMLLRAFGNLNLIWGAFILAEVVGIPLAMFLWKKGFSRVAGESNAGVTE